MNSKQPVTRLFVRPRNGHQWYRATTLLDTGSTITLISNNCRLLNDRKCNIFESKIFLRAFNGSTSQSSGETDIELVDEYNTKLQIHVAIGPVPHFDLLLGWDTLRNYDIQPRDGTIELHHKISRTKLVFRTQSKHYYYNINQCIVDPLSTKLISISSRGRFQNGLELVETLPEDKILQVVPTACDGTKPELEIFVKNLTTLPVLIRENCCVAVGSPVNSINVVERTTTNPLNFILRRDKQLPEMDWSQIQISDDLSSSRREAILNLTKEFHDVFSRGALDIGRYCGSRRYTIPLTTNEAQPRRIIEVPASQKELVSNHIDSLLAAGIVEPCTTSEITTNFLCVKKKDGTIRLCSDSRALNNVTANVTNFRIPKIVEILKALSGSKFYTSLDLNSAYHQVPIKESQKDLFTFIHPDGKSTYRYCTAPFGSKLISHFFQHLLANEVLKGIPACQIYIDDLVLNTQTFDQHLDVLRTVFSRFRKYNLTLKLKKCSFSTPSTMVFGYNVSEHGYKPAQERIEKLLKIQVPSTRANMKSQLAAIAYFRQSIPKFSHHAAKLYDVCKSSNKFELTAEIKSSWSNLLKQLSNAVLLTRPWWNNTMALTTDASTVAVGGYLTEEQNGKTVILATDSQLLTPSQRKWAPSQLELYGCYIMLKKWEKYLLFTQFKIKTDNMAVFYTLRNLAKYEISAHNGPSRYLTYISLFNFTTEHVRGTDPSFYLADMLSRRTISEDDHIRLNLKTNLPLVTVRSVLSKEDHALEEADKSYLSNRSSEKNAATNHTSDDNDDEMEDEHLVCSVYQVLDKPSQIDIDKLYMDIKTQQTKSVEVRKRLKNMKKNSKTYYRKKLERVGDADTHILYYKTDLYVPPRAINDLLQKIHKHESPKLMLKVLKDLHLYWPNMPKFVNDFHNSCVLCSTAKPQKSVGTPKNITIDTNVEVGHTICVDIAHIGQWYVHTAVDCASRYVKYYLLPNITAETIGHNLAIIFVDFNWPKQVRLDNATYYTSQAVKDLCNAFNVEMRFISRYNSAANTVAEQMNNRLQNQLRLFSTRMQHQNGKDLDFALKLTEFIVNSTPQQGKFTARELFLPLIAQTTWPINLPTLSKTKMASSNNAIKLAHEKALKIREQLYNHRLEMLELLKKEDLTIPSLKKGDYVRIRQMQPAKKLKKFWRPFGPEIYKVIDVLAYSKTALLERVEKSDRIRRIRMRCPFRLIKRIVRRSDLLDALRKDEVPTSLNEQDYHDSGTHGQPKLVDDVTPSQGNHQNDDEHHSDNRGQEKSIISPQAAQQKSDHDANALGSKDTSTESTNQKIQTPESSDPVGSSGRYNLRKRKRVTYK